MFGRHLLLAAKRGRPAPCADVLGGGILGTATGVWLFTTLRARSISSILDYYIFPKSALKKENVRLASAKWTRLLAHRDTSLDR
jgi:hypothetical protein